MLSGDPDSDARMSDYEARMLRMPQLYTVQGSSITNVTVIIRSLDHTVCDGVATRESAAVSQP